MPDCLASVPGVLTIRDLRRDKVLAPGGGRFPGVIRRFLPLVHGMSVALIPEDPSAAETVSTAVFEALAFRWHRLSRKTVLATWLVRTTGYAVARERSRLGLKAKVGTVSGFLAQRLFKEVNRLSPRYANAVLLCSFLKEAPDVVAKALNTTPTRVEGRHRKSVARLTRHLEKLANKLPKSEPVALPEMGSIPAAPPADAEERILAKLAQWNAKAAKSALVRSAVSAWQWRAVGKFFKGLGATAATIICLLVAFGFTMKYLIDTGRISLVSLWVSGMHKESLKQFPDMATPAQPWPTKPEEIEFAARQRPSNSANLYGLTNIWLAKLKLTSAQWKAAQPLHVPPAPRSPDGRMPLRNPKASRSGLAGAIGIDFPWSEGAFEFAGQSFPKVGVRFRGNGTYLQSLFGPKVSYKIDLNRVTKGQQIAGVTTLNFVNAIPDYSYLKDALAEKLFRELGATAPRTGFAYLTIDVPKKFDNHVLGLYVFIEDIDGHFAKDRFGTKDVPIFKPVTYELFADWGRDWSAYREIYDLKTKATPEQLGRVGEFAQLVSHASDEEFARKLPEFLDLEEYAAFVAGHVLLSSYDGYLSNGQNFYMYLDPRSNKFGFIPWDQDHAWGEFGYIGSAEKRETASIWKPASYNNKFLKRVLKVEAFRDVYRRKLEQGLAGPFSVERLNREIDALASIIRPAIAAESEFRLKRFELAISTNWVSGPRDGNFNEGTVEGPRTPAHQLKRFVLARTQSVRAQLDGTIEGALLSGFGN